LYQEVERARRNRKRPALLRASPKRERLVPVRGKIRTKEWAGEQNPRKNPSAKQKIGGARAPGRRTRLGDWSSRLTRWALLFFRIMWALLPSFAKLRGDRDGGLKFNVDLGPSEEATGPVRPNSHTTEASTHPLALKKIHILQTV
jgi:hypothetical protein